MNSTDLVKRGLSNDRSLGSYKNNKIHVYTMSLVLAFADSTHPFYTYIDLGTHV